MFAQRRLNELRFRKQLLITQAALHRRLMVLEQTLGTPSSHLAQLAARLP